MTFKRTTLGIASGILALSTTFFASPLISNAAGKQDGEHYHIYHYHKDGQSQTTTPIKHVVVIFGENVSFDHYFGTYPNAKNPAGEPQFHAKPGTPAVDGLTKNLLNNNPNLANPKRLDRSQAMTADMDHGYTAEQKAFDGGKMDKFVQNTSRGTDPSQVMNYYDGNTVTALWNYAQNYALNDHSFGTTFGPSTPGALNLISGQTNGATGYENGKKVGNMPNEVANGTVIGDPNPYYDKASPTAKPTVSMSGVNIGNKLNDKNVTWGWFEGGFRDTSATHKNIAGQSITDYSPHHEPFQYYKSTANPNHLAPSSPEMIGKTDQANHQYDLTDFWSSIDHGKMPAVSFLKAASYQDGHAGYSDPLDEQHFIVNTINRLQKLPEWKNTAVVIAYDDSDGWYDHVMGPQVNGSNDPAYDALYGPGNAGKPKLGNALDRAGYGPRLPLLVISPYAKQNFVDHTVTDQTSILKFIEDNWKLGQIGNGSYDTVANSLNNMFDFSHGPSHKKLFLDPTTGQPVSASDNSYKKDDHKASDKDNHEKNHHDGNKSEDQQDQHQDGKNNYESQN